MKTIITVIKALWLALTYTQQEECECCPDYGSQTCTHCPSLKVGEKQ